MYDTKQKVHHHHNATQQQPRQDHHTTQKLTKIPTMFFI